MSLVVFPNLFLIPIKYLMKSFTHSRHLVEALLGRIVLPTVLHVKKQRNVVIDQEAVVALDRTAVYLVAELAPDSYVRVCTAATVMFDHHFIDVSGARALATRQDARIVVHLVAAGELAHHYLLERIHLVQWSACLILVNRKRDAFNYQNKNGYVANTKTKYPKLLQLKTTKTNELHICS